MLSVAFHNNMYKLGIVCQQHAGNAVKRATDALVQAALQSKGNVNYEETITVNQKMVSGMAQVCVC